MSAGANDVPIYRDTEGRSREEVIASTEAAIKQAVPHEHPVALVETRPGTFEMTCDTCGVRIATVTLFTESDK